MATKPFIYALSTCSHCKRTKEFLAECGVDYDFIDVDLCQGEERKNVIEDVKKYNPRCTFPTVIIDGRVIIGFREEDLKKALGME